VKKKFKVEVSSGHKEDAVEVPFDRAKEWGLPPKPLWRGYLVNATVNSFSFESSIVPRQRTFYLLITAEAKKAAGVSEGVVVQVAVEPYVE